jgi:hypothetical protein
MRRRSLERYALVQNLPSEMHILPRRGSARAHAATSLVQHLEFKRRQTCHN